MFHEGTCACVNERCAKSKFYLCMRRASPTRYERSQCRAFTAPAMSPGSRFRRQSISPCSRATDAIYGRSDAQGSPLGPSFWRCGGVAVTRRFCLASRSRICRMTIRAGVRGVFVDIDDTLTTRGRLTARAYAALEALKQSGKLVIPVTGRPAGWCDHIARMWPVSAVVGENGAFYFHYDRSQAHDVPPLARLGRRARGQTPPARAHWPSISCVTCPARAWRRTSTTERPTWPSTFAKMCGGFARRTSSVSWRCSSTAGATAKVSSIHVNGWFGSYDKLSMTRTLDAARSLVSRSIRRTRALCVCRRLTQRRAHVCVFPARGRCGQCLRVFATGRCSSHAT